MNASLAAVHLSEPFDAWLDEVPDVLSTFGYTVSKQKHALRCWKIEWVRLHKNRVSYAEGFEVRRLWIGRGRGALGVSPRRIYLDDQGTSDIRRETEILGGLPRPAIQVAITLERQGELLGVMSRAPCTAGQLMLKNTDCSVSDAVKIHSGNGEMAPDENLRMFLRLHGFHQPTDKLTLAIIPTSDACRNAAEGFRHKVSGWFKERGNVTNICVCDTGPLEVRLEELKRGDSLRNSGTVTVFILPGADNTTTVDTLKLMRRMDRCDLRWRRARATDDQTWSVEDQLGSLVMASGGIPYFVTLDQEPLPWAIGIDISHPINAPLSTACAALTDPGGNLVHAWTIQHPRNEQMPEHSIRKLIDAAVRRIVKMDSDPDILIIRDGRIFEHENARHYTEQSVGRVTLLELRKGGNPLMLLGDAPVLPAQPTAALISGGDRDQHVAFIVTNPDVAFGFAQVLKLHWEDRWNAIGMDAGQLTRTISGLSYSPGLGLHRHTLPGPIYWADGIAGSSNSDLRFRGQRVTQFN